MPDSAYRYANRGLRVPEMASWDIMAETLVTARGYEWQNKAL